MLLLYFIAVHLILLVPGYVLVKRSGLLENKPNLELCAAYLVSIVGLATFAIAGYVFNVPEGWLQGGFWALIGVSVTLFLQDRLYEDLKKFRFPLAALVLTSMFSIAFISLQLSGPRAYIPDPEFNAAHNYNVFNVKVLNVAQTNANDNYVPYRQAQFMINRSDPAKDSFIDEWGVHFFQRTPLMGAVTAQYFTLFDDDPPIGYTWSGDFLGQDPDDTYLKFQVIAQIMNALFILPAFFLLTKLFNRKTAMISLLFMIPNAFFLYNAYFSWPKSLVAFFILFSWLLLYEKRMRYVLLAGAASGMAYLAHDLAMLYIGASVLLLLHGRRFRDILMFIVAAALFALPWLITSAFIYDKPSTFIYYPFSLKGIPQVDQKDAIIREFFNTSPLKIIGIKLEFLFYLLSPYQLLFSEGGQELGRRLWAGTLFNVPGAIGLGLIVPTAIGAVKKIRNLPFWIMALVPIVLCTLVIGWPKGLGALHFAQASVVLFIGLGVSVLLTLKRKLWTILAFAANCVQLIFFGLYSYGFRSDDWFTNFGDAVLLVFQLAVLALCGASVYLVTIGKTNAVWHRLSAKIPRRSGWV